MSRSLMGRLAAQPIINRVTPRIAFSATRAFSQTPRWQDKDDKPKSASQSFLDNLHVPGAPTIPKVDPEENSMTSLTQSSVFSAFEKSGVDTRALSFSEPQAPVDEEYEPYHLHVNATKHNTIVTCTKPNRDAIVSMGTGCLGYRKSRRKGFDPAYSLTKYIIERLIHQGWPPKMKKLEVVLKGYGPGREAAIKVLMSPEGKVLRDKIVRVADSTKIKFGGTRSPKPRRLG